MQKKMKDATEGWNQASSELNKMRNDAARREEVIKVGFQLGFSLYYPF